MSEPDPKDIVRGKRLAITQIAAATVFAGVIIYILVSQWGTQSTGEMIVLVGLLSIFVYSVSKQLKRLAYFVDGQLPPARLGDPAGPTGAERQAERDRRERENRD